MIRRLSVVAPSLRPTRLLAVSDEIDPALWEHLDRTKLGSLDLLVSCGDLPPDYLSYLEGTLRIPFVFVTGNHDLDEAWRQEAALRLPEHRAGARLREAAGLAIALLDWPGSGKARTSSQERIAWRHAFGLWLASRLRLASPSIVVSHVAPRDGADSPDVYHRGFRAYRWLAERLRPVLWLHGHTTPASVPERVTHIGPTTCVNVTGAFLVEIVPGEDGVSRPGERSGGPRDGPRSGARSASRRG